MPNMFTQLAREALAIEADIPYRVNNPQNSRLFDDGFDIYIFDQVWGSTALGFGGMGGNAITKAKTYVLVPQVENENCLVYFAGRFAYSVPYSKAFAEDVITGRMEPVYKAGKYKLPAT